MFSLQTRCVLLNGPCRILLGGRAPSDQAIFGAPPQSRGGWKVTPSAWSKNGWCPSLHSLNTETGVKKEQGLCDP